MQCTFFNFQESGPAAAIAILLVDLGQKLLMACLQAPRAITAPGQDCCSRGHWAILHTCSSALKSILRPLPGLALTPSYPLQAARGHDESAEVHMRLTGVRLGAQGPMERTALAAPPTPPASQATCATGLARSRHPCTPHPQMPYSARRSWTLPPGQVRHSCKELLHPHISKRPPINDRQQVTMVTERPKTH